MTCPECDKEVVADRLFCTWCESFVPRRVAGTRAGLVRRWVGTAIDPLLVVVAIFLPAGIAGGIGGEALGPLLALVAVGAVLVAFFRLFRRGMTPGKYVVGVQVVNKLDGGNPGLGRMLIRELVGKFVSGLFLGLGFFWAIWDKDSQAWHDKLAGTVVVRRVEKVAARSVPIAT